MKPRYCRLLFVVFSVGLLAQTRAAFGEEAWTFVWAEPARSDYEIWKGSAVVTRTGGSLSAKLRSEKGAEIVFAGNVSKGKVKARLTILGSEFGDIPFSGDYVVRRWPDAALLQDAPSETHSIVLTDGLNVLALKREVFAAPPEIPPTRSQ